MSISYPEPVKGFKITDYVKIPPNFPLHGRSYMSFEQFDEAIQRYLRMAASETCCDQAPYIAFKAATLMEIAQKARRLGARGVYVA